MLAVGCEDRSEQPGQDSRGPAVTINGHTWQVEPAVTPEQRRRGLAGREKVPPGRGMLFIYPRPGIKTFWMKGCLVPLDVAFISADLRVVQMHTMPVDLDGKDLPEYSSGVPVQYALEVRDGALEEAKVRIGHRVGLSPEVPPPAKAEPGP